MASAIDAESLTLLRDSLSRFRQEHYTFDQRRRSLGEKGGFRQEVWRDYARLGWLALALPAEHGGVDGAPEAIGALMEFTGHALAMEPILASAVLCGRALARCRDDRVVNWLAEIASGEAVYAFAHAESAGDGIGSRVQTVFRNGRLSGTKTVVLHGDVARRLIVTTQDVHRDTLTLCYVDAQGLSRDAYRLVDGRGAASFKFADTPAASIQIDGDPNRAIEDALDDARLAMCAEAYGAMCWLIDATTEHLKTRKQFGRPIGANQALQHRMVEMFMLQEEVRALLDAAHRAYAGPWDARIRAISAAAAYSTSAARIIAHEAIQLHGGIGVTEELPVSHYFKRLMVTARLLGSYEDHLKQFASV